LCVQRSLVQIVGSSLESSVPIVLAIHYDKLAITESRARELADCIICGKMRGQARPALEEDLSTSPVTRIVDLAEEVSHECELILSLDTSSYEIQVSEAISSLHPERTEAIMQMVPPRSEMEARSYKQGKYAYLLSVAPELMSEAHEGSSGEIVMADEGW
jgi:hypothetical protein